MPWEVRQQRGVFLPQIGWALDAQRPAPRAIISHAHSDHVARHQETLCTPETARLIRERVGGPGRRVWRTLPVGQTESLTPDCQITLLSAGHITGSALTLLEHQQHGRLLYTGDFKIRPGRVAAPCARPKADVLVMETTFGLPRYVMPSTEEVETRLVQFCREALATGATPVLLAYALGKTQELAALLGEASLPVMLEENAWQLTRACGELGVRLPPCEKFDPQAHAGRVVICPQRAEILKWIHPRRTAVVTGWALDKSTRFAAGADEAFALSDHADFNELLAFVEAVEPKVVYTLHGYAREFATTLRARGVEAWALGRGNQLELSLSL